MTLQNILRLCLLSSGFGLAYQLFLLGRIKIVLLVVLFVAIWLIGQSRRWNWVSYPVLILFAGLSVQLLLLEVSPHWVLAVFTALICAWDLDYFLRRLNRKQEVRNRHEIESRHIKRLLVVVVLGVAFGELIFRTSMEIDLVWIALLAIGAALGLHQFLSKTRAK